MEIMSRENENAFSGPRPMEISTIPHGGKQRTSSLEAPIMLLTGHPSAVYTMKFNPSGTLIASGSHDREIFLWRVHGDCKNFMVLKGHKNAILDLHWTGDGLQVVSASPDKTSYVSGWYLDGILILSPDGSYLLTNGMDNKLCVWDMRPYAPANRCVKVFEGHQHNFEKNLLKCSWSPDGTKVTAGSADRMVHIWDTTTRRILYKLPGHKGSVNECVFHPTEPIIGSCSSDKDIYLGEI